MLQETKYLTANNINNDNVKKTTFYEKCVQLNGRMEYDRDEFIAKEYSKKIQYLTKLNNNDIDILINKTKNQKGKINSDEIIVNTQNAIIMDHSTYNQIKINNVENVILKNVNSNNRLLPKGVIRLNNVLYFYDNNDQNEANRNKLIENLTNPYKIINYEKDTEKDKMIFQLPLLKQPIHIIPQIQCKGIIHNIFDYYPKILPYIPEPNNPDIEFNNIMQTYDISNLVRVFNYYRTFNSMGLNLHTIIPDLVVVLDLNLNQLNYKINEIGQKSINLYSYKTPFESGLLAKIYQYIKNNSMNEIWVNRWSNNDNHNIFYYYMAYINQVYPKTINIDVKANYTQLIGLMKQEQNNAGPFLNPINCNKVENEKDPLSKLYQLGCQYINTITYNN
jgi:hypothetical protein